MAVVKKMASGFGFHTVRMKASGFVGIKKNDWGDEDLELADEEDGLQIPLGKHYNLEIDPLRSDQRMWGGHTLIIRDQTRRTGVTILLGSYNLVLVVHPTVKV
ncbi:hypothetical protein Tco_1550894 [Tanacetum coccineum]